MDKLYEDGTGIFQILDAIEDWTGLFILNKNLDYLYSFIWGYLFLARETKTEIKNIEKLDQYSLFLKEEFNDEYENSLGWFGQLHSKFGSEQGFIKLFEYLHKFKVINNYWRYMTIKQKLIMFLISCDPGIRDIYTMTNVYDRAYFPSKVTENLDILLDNNLINVAQNFDNGTANKYGITENGRKYLDENFDA